MWPQRSAKRRRKENFRITISGPGFFPTNELRKPAGIKMHV
jgi:hypothetical protein